MRNVVLLRKEFERPTVGDLIRRYMTELDRPAKPFGPTVRNSLLQLLERPIAKVYAEELDSSDVIQHCQARITDDGVCPATVKQDITFLRGPLKYARPAWKLNVSDAAIVEAMPMLQKHGLVGKSRPRERRPSPLEFEMLMDYFRSQNEHHRTEIPMEIILEFAVTSLKRESEITRLKWVDYNPEKMTCILRDMKDPKNKKGNDFEFPLLGRALDLVKAQPRLDPNDPNECIFPYNEKCVGQRFTLACKTLGIKDLHFHDMRREGICRMFEAGYGPQEVAAVSGHKNWAILARVYANKFNPTDLHKGPAALRALRAQDLARASSATA